MSGWRLWMILSSVAIVAFAVELAYHYPALPQQVALHFDGAGRPDGWGSKQELLAWTVGGLAIVLGILLPSVWLIAILPASLINLPHRDYWLAPERGAETRRKLIDRMGWFVFATLLLVVVVFRIAVQANLRQPPQATIPYGYLVAYFLFVAVWLIELYWHFRLPPTEANWSSLSKEMVLLDSSHDAERSD